MFFGEERVKKVGFSGVGDKNFDSRFTRIDPDTSLEHILFYGSIICFVVALGLKYGLKLDPEDSLPLVFAGLSIFFAMTRLGTDCTYVLDNQNKEIYYSFAVFGFPSTYKVCSFSDVTKLGIKIRRTYSRKNSRTWSGKRAYSLESTVVMELKGRIRFEISRRDNELDRVSSYGQALAHHIGCEWALLNGEESTLVPNDEEVPKQECDLQWATWGELITAGPSEVILVIVSIGIFAAIYTGVDLTDFLRSSRSSRNYR